MATTLNATLSLAVVGSVVETGTLTDNFERINLANSLSYTDGTGTSQANRWRRFVATNPGTPVTYNLETTFTDSFGRTLDFAVVKGFAIINNDTTAGEHLRLSGGWIALAFGGELTDERLVQAQGGMLVFASPIGQPVVPGDSDEIIVDGNGSSVDFEMWILGNT